MKGLNQKSDIGGTAEMAKATWGYMTAVHQTDAVKKNILLEEAAVLSPL